MNKDTVRENWDHSSFQQFYQYYADQTSTENYIKNAYSICKMLLRIHQEHNKSKNKPLNFADIGCGTGVHSILMSQFGHNAYGIDVNEPLINLARKRAAESEVKVDFRVGSALDLPYDSKCMEFCLALEVLEHIKDWDLVIRETTRILKNNGILCLSTTNRLCPIQNEFNLPLYSWYPRFLKKRFEKLATDSKPELVNYAKYPAINWFTYYDLKNFLEDLNFVCFDRFDVMDISNKPNHLKFIISTVRSSALTRFLANFLTVSTFIVAIKRE